MTITKNDGRQDLVTAHVDITYDMLTSGSALAAIEVPGGAVVVDGFLQVVTAMDSGTSDSLEVGDAADNNRYTSSAVDGQTVGLTALDIDGHEYTQQTDITVKWTGAGSAPTAGALRLVVMYFDTGRAHFTQG